MIEGIRNDRIGDIVEDAQRVVSGIGVKAVQLIEIAADQGSGDDNDGYGTADIVSERPVDGLKGEGFRSP